MCGDSKHGRRAYRIMANLRQIVPLNWKSINSIENWDSVFQGGPSMHHSSSPASMWDDDAYAPELQWLITWKINPILFWRGFQKPEGFGGFTCSSACSNDDVMFYLAILSTFPAMETPSLILELTYARTSNLWYEVKASYWGKRAGGTAGEPRLE